MGYIRDVKRPEAVKDMKPGELKKEYNLIAESYLRLIQFDEILCPVCGKMKAARTGNFYANDGYIHGFYPVCADCLYREAANVEKPTDVPNETKTSVQRVLRKMNKPYIESLYMSCVKLFNEDNHEEGDRQKGLPFKSYMRQINSLQQHRGKTWEDSDFGGSKYAERPEVMEVEDEDEEIIKRGRKRFGAYTADDLYQLESSYEDWVHRYPAEAKAQEVLFKQLCIQELRADNMAKNGEDPKDAIKSCQEIMTSLGIKPSQSTSDSLTDAKSFGELIKAWEIDKPIPEPEGEWKDVDRIGLMIDVFFKGHLVKMLNIKNAFSSIYENFMAKLTVKRPQLSEDDDTEAIFDEIFGEKMAEEFNTEDGS